MPQGLALRTYSEPDARKSRTASTASWLGMSTIYSPSQRSPFERTDPFRLPGPKKSLMLIEDNGDDEMLTVRAITKSGIPCNIEVLRHGGEAIARLIAPEGPIPALIILDFHLPGYNGLEILRALRKQPRTRHVPVVILSGLGSDDEVSDCLEGGANSCVQKPMDSTVYIDHVALIVRYWLTVDNSPDNRALSAIPPSGNP